MAAMTTALTEFSNNGNSRTSTLTGHAVGDPKLVIEKRRVPEGNQVVAESSVKVVYQTEDADGEVISSKVTFEAISRFPYKGDTTDRDAALAVFRDIIAGDEYANTVGTQEWLT